MHITHVCPRFKEVHGGGEPVLLHLFNNLVALGHGTTVHTPGIPASMAKPIDKRVEIRKLPPIFQKKFSNVLLQGFFDLFSCAFLAATIPRNTDLVCFHTETVVPALFLYKLFFRRTPCIYFCFQPPRFAYDTARETSRSGGVVGRLVPIFSILYRPLDRCAVRFAKKVLTFSTDYKRWIESIYGISDIEVLPPGVETAKDLPEILESVRHHLSQPGAKVLVFVGKLIPWKNVDRLIDITSIVKRSIPNIKCLIVGDGPCMRALVEQTNRAGMEETVIFCGYVGPKEVLAYCSAADLMVLLEHNVSFGLSLVEANACDLPAMAFEGGGPNDIIRHGETGIILPREATNAFIADQISHLLQDDARLKSMRTAAGECSKQYTWPRFAEMFVDAAKQTLDRCR